MTRTSTPLVIHTSDSAVQIQKLHSSKEYRIAHEHMRTRNCDGGEKTTYSQTKRHEQKERLSSNKCMAAHSTTSANSTLWQPNNEVSQRSVCKYMTRHQIILFHYNKNAAGYALAYQIRPRLRLRRNRDKENQRKRKYTGCQNRRFANHAKTHGHFALLVKKWCFILFLGGRGGPGRRHGVDPLEGL